MQKMKVKKPWGAYEVLLDEPNYKVKRIVVHPYERFSLQYHKHREEHWVIVEKKILSDWKMITEDLTLT